MKISSEIHNIKYGINMENLNKNYFGIRIRVKDLIDLFHNAVTEI